MEGAPVVSIQEFQSDESKIEKLHTIAKNHNDSVMMSAPDTEVRIPDTVNPSTHEMIPIKIQLQY